MKYSKDPRVDRSLRHSVRDGMGCSAMAGAGESYLSAFAIFLKATAPQVALLATLPPLLGALAQLLAAYLARRFRRRKPLVLLGATIQGAMWLAMLALPLRFPAQAPLILVGLATLYYAAGNLTAPLWMSWMGDLVPERRRGRFFGRRTRLTTMSSFAALLLGGLLLHSFDGAGLTRWGYVALFVFAFTARMLSVYQLARMHEPERALPAAAAPEGARGRWRQMRERGALRFTTYAVLMQFAVAVSGPFFAIYMLRVLEFSYLQFTVNLAASVLVQFLTLNAWGRISDVFGNRLILSVTSLLLPFIPMMWLISDHYAWLLLAQCLAGVSWGGFSLSAGNLLYELVPAEQRTSYAASHNVLTAAGMFLGGMLGATLFPLLPDRAPLLGGGELTPILYIFLASGLLRMMVATLFLRRVRELRPPRKQMSTAAFMFRVARVNAFVGIAYEFLTSFRPESRAQEVKEAAEELPIDPDTAPADQPPPARPAHSSGS